MTFSLPAGASSRHGSRLLPTRRRMAMDPPGGAQRRRLSPPRDGSPRDAVTPAKRRKLARSASHYMLAHREQECAYRADIIEVALLRGSVAAVRHLQGAFSIEAELEKLSG